MKTSTLELNPFSLMMEPELVLQTIERSQQLRGLRRHKMRPLDKPLIPLTKEAMATRAAFDAAIDAEEMDDFMDGPLLN
jgi:tRNA A37 threonylcarbamoyladenosine synthetase subunit TsaC/SUA5/YrdC